MNRSRSALGFVGVFIAFWALIIASIAVAVANNNDSSSASDSSSAPIAVNLSEFAITPNHLSAKPGNVTLQVTNAGSGIHNLALKGADATTADLNAGEGATLDLGELDAGEYTLYCTIPGHESAGMSAMLMVDENATSTVAASAPMTAEEMDEIMKAVTLRFPEETAGLGAQVMEPDILADGTKQFDLTASVVDWEVEGGKTVKAFAYNGVVPGPTIKVDVGDKVRLVLHNEMTESTSIHFHGIRVPNEYDGVPDITQEPVKPGESFVYEFTTKEPAVGI